MPDFTKLACDAAKFASAFALAPAAAKANNHAMIAALQKSIGV